MNAVARPTPLRWRTGWLVLGLVLMALVACTALLPATRRLTGLALMLPQGDKLLHGLAFTALMGWWGNVWRRRRARLVAAAACLLFGVLIECAQWPYSPDDADPFDVLADALGIGLGLLLLRTPLADVLARSEAWLMDTRTG